MKIQLTESEALSIIRDALSHVPGFVYSEIEIVRPGTSVFAVPFSLSVPCPDHIKGMFPKDRRDLTNLVAIVKAIRAHFG